MDVELRENGRTLRCTVAHDGAEHVTVSVACACGSKRVRGVRPEVGEHQAEADALCADCGAARGRIVARFATIFGRTEDEAVLKHGRARVYG